MTAILYYITALLCVVTVNEACKCAVLHPQTNFCNADFGKILFTCVFLFGLVKFRSRPFSFSFARSGMIDIRALEKLSVDTRLFQVPWNLTWKPIPQIQVLFDLQPKKYQ